MKIQVHINDLNENLKTFRGELWRPFYIWIVYIQVSILVEFKETHEISANILDDLIDDFFSLLNLQKNKKNMFKIVIFEKLFENL